MDTAGMDVRWRGTPARRRTLVGLAVALVLSSSFATRAAAADDLDPTAATTTMLPAAAPLEPAAEPCVSTPTTTGEPGTASGITAEDGSASTSTTAGPPPACEVEKDAGGSPHSSRDDDCDDTGGSPTGAPRPQCPSQPKGPPEGPDDRLADCAGDIYQQSCADLVLALRVQCASATWSPWCISTAPGMLMICHDGGQWSATPCEQVRPTLVRYCSEVPDADPERCPAIAPAGDGGEPEAGTPPGPTNDQSGGAGEGRTDAGGSPRSSPLGGSPTGMAAGAVELEPVDQPIGAPLASPQAAAVPAKVSKKSSAAVRPTEVVAKAEPAPAADATPTTLAGIGLGVEGSAVASDGATLALAVEPGIEGFAPTRAMPSADGEGVADAIELASGPDRRDRSASGQRASDRWSLVPLVGALLLVMITSAYDLRGRRRW
jgi:hypothetical protein